jgi:hypothetical protein
MPHSEAKEQRNYHKIEHGIWIIKWIGCKFIKLSGLICKTSNRNQIVSTQKKPKWSFSIWIWTKGLNSMFSQHAHKQNWHVRRRKVSRNENKQGRNHRFCVQLWILLRCCHFSQGNQNNLDISCIWRVCHVSTDTINLHGWTVFLVCVDRKMALGNRNIVCCWSVCFISRGCRKAEKCA